MTDSENELIFLFSFLFLKIFTGIFRGKSKDCGKINEGEGGIRNEWSMVVIMYEEVSVDRFAKVKDD